MNQPQKKLEIIVKPIVDDKPLRYGLYINGQKIYENHWDKATIQMGLVVKKAFEIVGVEADIREI